MKKFKKAFALVLCFALIAGLAVVGTVAYMTDEDSDVNVMTVGDIDIEQIELQRAENVAHTGLLKEGDLVPSKQGQMLAPAYPKTDAELPYTAEQTDLLYWGPYVTAESDGTTSGAGNGLWNDDKLTGAMDKFVFVENTGSADAYYRTWIALECPQGMEFSEDSDKEFMWNANSNNRFTWETLGYHDIDGTRYLVACATYNNILAAGEISRPSLLQVVMTHNATNEQVQLLGDTYDILTYTQAVQVENMPNAEKALVAAFKEVAPENMPWADKTVEIPVLVKDAEELAVALNAGKSIALTDDIVLEDTVNITAATDIDLNGHNLTVSVLEAKEDTTVSNGTITHGKSTYPALSVSAGTLTLEDVDVVCEEPCNIVTSGTAQASEYAGLEIWSGKCVLNNSTITVKCDTMRYSNSLFGVGIHEGELTMNGGAITVTSVGSTKEKYDYQAAIFAGSASDKVVNLNDVAINIGEKAEFLFAWGGNVTVNTTDAEGTWDALVDTSVSGGTYTINYVG